MDGELTNSHSRLKHTEVELTPFVLSTLETLLNGFVKENTQGDHGNEVLVPETQCKCFLLI